MINYTHIHDIFQQTNGIVPTQYLLENGVSYYDIKKFLADATLYLEYFSILVIAWIWLKQAVVAEKGLAAATSEAEQRFYEGKLQAFSFFFEYELPKTVGMKIRLNSPVRVTLDTAPEMLV